MKNRVLRHLLVVSSALALLGQTATTSRAGAGWGDSTDITGAPIKVPTYYANSPSGLRPDPLGGAAIDTGLPLRKFVDGLPGVPGLSPIPANNLGQYIPLAVADKAKYPGSDYYEIAVVEYAEKLHSDLPKATTLRGYVQLETPANAAVSRHIPLKYPDGTAITDSAGSQVYGVDTPHYLGPLVSAARGTPVRIKYSNLLPRGGYNSATGHRNGDLFLPVDETLMGAGFGPDGVTKYTQNRAVIHFHGGDTPWISDGTPHQWITPAEEITPYPKGVSFQNVPDMPDPGPGSGTLYYPNGQSARMMWFHDHSLGLTRLNVYGGEAAPYLLSDPVEQGLVASGTIPAEQIPLIIQEKTFVPQDITLQDAKWDTAHWGEPGDLWYPHVYETNQDPTSFDGTNPPGRWDYGPWFWPVFAAPNPLPTGVYGDVTTTPEAYGDTPVVNGTAYPTVTVNPKAYRLRILNASNDRHFNLGLYTATMAVSGCTVTAGGAGYDPTTTTVQFVGGLDPAIPNAQAATGTPTVNASGVLTGITLTSFGSGYVSPPAVTITDTTVPGGTGAAATCTLSGLTEVAMVPFDSSGTFPATGGLTGTGWGTPDARVGGVPSPATAGPPMIVIGNEGGFLPNPAVVPSTPINYEYNKRSVTILNVLEHGLYLGPAERADVVVDFSQFAGKTLILYNDAPTPLPAGDPRVDYYTDNPDFTATGGAPRTLPGYGPNTRTVMQIVVNAAPAGTVPVPFNTAALTAALPVAYAATQPRPVVAEAAYNTAFGTTFTDTYARIFTGSATTPTFNFPTGDAISYLPTGATTPVTAAAGQIAQLPVQHHAIQELFDRQGRMNATLGIEIPMTNVMKPTTIPLGYADPTTETISDGETRIWKITHNGVDTHPVHFHLVNVQLINRVGWDGTVKPPDDTEVGWKETVKMNPLEDVIVAVRAKKPQLPGFGLPNSVRPMDPTQPLGSIMGLTQVDVTTGNPAVVTNAMADYGWEYVWHCHILGHEENDFMRAFVLRVVNTVPNAPSNLAATQGVSLTWSDNSADEIGFRIERATVVNGVAGAFAAVGTALANATMYIDLTAQPSVTYAYGVVAFNAAGNSPASNTATITTVAGAPWAPIIGTATAGNAQATVTFTPPGSNGGSAIIRYTVTSSPGGKTATGTLSPITVTGLTNGTSYTFTVTATNAVGTGPASSPSNAVTPVTVPGPPAVGIVTPGNAQATVAFTPPASTGGSAILLYTVTSSPGGVTATGTSSPITVTGLTNGTSYTFTVTAANAVGVGPASGPSTAVTVGLLPGAPAIGVATAGNGQATVTFTPPAANGSSAVTSYTVTSAPGGIKATGAGTPITVGGLTNGTAYTFTVTATNVIGTGPASTSSNAVTPAAPPGAPRIGTVTAANGQATVMFTAPASNGGSPVTVYTVTSTPGGITATGKSSPIVITGLVNGTAYTFTLTATNAAGTGPASSPSASVTPAGPPGAPTIGTVTPRNGQAVVAFTAPASTGGSTIIRYTVTSRPGGLTATGTSSPVTVSGLINGTAYTFTVTATNTIGISPPSAASTPVTPAAPPGAPTIGTATAGNAQASVTFTTPASNGGSAITSYTVTSSPGGITATGTASPIAINGLLNRTTYTFTVTAANAVGSGPASAASNPVVPAASAPAAPTGLAAVVTAGVVNLTWTDKSTNETGFRVERALGAGAFAAVTTVAANTTSYADATVSSGTAYSYRVFAVNAAGSSPASNIAAVTVPKAAVASATLTIPTNATSAGSVSVTAAASTTLGATYVFQYRKVGTAAWTAFNGGSIRNPTITGLIPGVYQFQVYVTANGFAASSVTPGSNTCTVSNVAVAPATLTVPATTTTGRVTVVAAASPTPTVVYVFEYQKQGTTTWTQIYRGPLASPTLLLPARGTYLLRVKVSDPGTAAPVYADSPYTSGKNAVKW
jgi:FtsP/CotA-like multicopper oxidase with cupredoxin domain/fibronectin type 3 domain-containing protein